MRFTRFAFVVPSLVLFACTEEPSDATTFMPDDTSGTSDTMTTTMPTTTTNTSTDPSTESSTTDDPSTTMTTSVSVDSSSSEDDGGSLCGDGVVSGMEECDCGGFPCDEMSLGGASCVDVEDPTIPGTITGGVLGCNMASCRFDTSMCTYCGDEEVNGIEACEEDEEINTTCEALGAGAAGPLSCDANCQIDTSACTECAFVVDFEDDGTCAEGFSTVSLDAGASASSWACGEPTVYALGPGVASPGTYGTNLSGPYNANEISALVSPEIDMSDCKDAGLVLSLRHWHNFEGGASNSDGGIVQASEDGVTWTTIAPTGGDLYDDSPITATYGPVNGVLGFSGSQDDNQWSLSEFDLSDYAGSTTLQLRFVMGSNAATQQGGWYIDRLEILGSGT